MWESCIPGDYECDTGLTCGDMADGTSACIPQETCSSEGVVCNELAAAAVPAAVAVTAEATGMGLEGMACMP